MPIVFHADLDRKTPDGREARARMLRLLAASHGTQGVYLEELGRVVDETLSGESVEEMVTRCAQLIDALVLAANGVIGGLIHFLDEQGVELDSQDVLMAIERFGGDGVESES